ncbi:conserved hypothetical protein [Gloeothece citriformis PCC 7424]|uniref:DUF4351 domain-containing protein n=1 Tax=Gloeothece citriformis (strain PCC 7424) TaxID=65393 RepID=B7KFT4_GLOC7|nr:DUF4351 domain-containing protein [Gloeothece citriformis]ACK73409.1 conserved hypothetical protein [Gloeothece citriformis PCC 7424]
MNYLFDASFREDIMKESVIYQDILQQGRQQESLLLVTRLIKKRFGEVEPILIDRVSVLSVEELEALIEALFDMLDVADLVTWLQDQ